ncbi:hypothetical protein [Mycolicibacter icosiumassiliensis]|uniref:hypothetical protein n=1 Tax=Mycolicibacter icosiumassiliensis TaxID=1792835 RepID=UPI00082F675C|nr:hypothetical protein [Mycolicibacter icosiumassiliensis]
MTATTADDVAIIEEDTDGVLFTQHPGQFQPLAAFITVNFDGDVPSMYAESPECNPYRPFERSFGIDPTLTASAVNGIMRGIAADVAEAFDALDTVFNRHSGLYEPDFDAEDVRDVIARIEATVESGSESGERFSGVEINDEYLGYDMNDEVAAVTADSTDAELAELTSAAVNELAVESESEGYVVTRFINSDIHPLLEARRDELIAERGWTAESVCG